MAGNASGYSPPGIYLFDRNVIDIPGGRHTYRGCGPGRSGILHSDYFLWEIQLENGAVHIGKFTEGHGDDSNDYCRICRIQSDIGAHWRQ